MRIPRVILAAALLMLGAAAEPAARQAPVVAAASDLKFPLETIAGQFTAGSGERVTLLFGSSGTFTRQLLDGAPFELFLSADEAYVDRLAAAGLTRDRGVLYAMGRLVVFAPHGSPLTVDPQLDGLGALLSRGRLTRLAIANPQHAPYGRAAEAALRARRLWDAMQGRLVLGENVAQAAQFASSGDTVGGILAYSLVLSPPLSARGTHALLPESSHPPLRQRMVLMKRAGSVAERFYAYLQGPSARAVLREYGFTVGAD